MCVVACVASLYRGLFLFKQKTAYEMRISDGSSDVCSSDLFSDDALSGAQFGVGRHSYVTNPIVTLPHRRPALIDGQIELLNQPGEIGRASCRVSVCQYV